MDIELSNFGKVRKAKIELNGLTVIAGKNDTGKSTVGKAIYATLKTLAGFPNEAQRLHNRNIALLLENIITPLFRDKKYEGSFGEALPVYLMISQLKAKKSNKEDANDAIELIENLRKNEKFLFSKKEIQYVIDRIKEMSKEEEFFRILSSDVFNSVFESNLNNSVHLDDTLSLSYNINRECVFELMAESNDITEAYINNKVKDVFLSDAILIDSPLYLEWQINSSSPYSKDLKNKLKKASRFKSVFDALSVAQDLKDVLQDSSFELNEQTKHIEYRVSSKKRSALLDISNIASGAKTFGIISLLLKSNVINPNTMLILDEPENHLHPEWQIKYAKILVEMAAAKIPILLTSHSPTLIQALMQFARKKMDPGYVNFYLASKEDDNYSSFENVNDDIDRIFSNLIDPTDVLFDVD